MKTVEDGMLPAAAPMSEIAGKIATRLVYTPQRSLARACILLRDWVAGGDVMVIVRGVGTTSDLDRDPGYPPRHTSSSSRSRSTVGARSRTVRRRGCCSTSSTGTSPRKTLPNRVARVLVDVPVDLDRCAARAAGARHRSRCTWLMFGIDRRCFETSHPTTRNRTFTSTCTTDIRVATLPGVEPITSTMPTWKRAACTRLPRRRGRRR